MVSNIFLAAVTQPDFDNTVVSSVSVDEYPDYPDALAGSTEVRLWGAPDSAETHFEKLDAGDLVLFVDGERYVGVGTVGQTFVAEEDWARSNLWDETDVKRLYTLEEFSEISVPKSAVNRIFDYGTGYSPGPLMRVADKRITRRPVVIRRALEQYTGKHD